MHFGKHGCESLFAMETSIHVGETNCYCTTTCWRRNCRKAHMVWAFVLRKLRTFKVGAGSLCPQRRGENRRWLRGREGGGGWGSVKGYQKVSTMFATEEKDVSILVVMSCGSLIVMKHLFQNLSRAIKDLDILTKHCVSYVPLSL